MVYHQRLPEHGVGLFAASLLEPEKQLAELGPGLELELELEPAPVHVHEPGLAPGPGLELGQPGLVPGPALEPELGPLAPEPQPRQTAAERGQRLPVVVVEAQYFEIKPCWGR